MKILIRDTEERLILEHHGAESITVSELKEQLRHKLELNDCDDLKLLCNRKILSDQLPLSTFAEDSTVNLQFLTEKRVTENAVQKEKVLINIDSRNLIRKNGKLYFVTYRKRRFNILKKVFGRLRNEFMLKLLITLLLFAIKKTELAILLLLILLLRSLSNMKIRFANNLNHIPTAIWKTTFMFFYTMFVISGDEQILYSGITG